MGRTLPTATDLLHREIKEWREFRALLPKSQRKQFDEMLKGAHRYNYAMMMSIPKQPIAFRLVLMSVIFHHYVQLTELKDRLENR